MQMSYIKLASEMKTCFPPYGGNIFKMRLQLCTNYITNSGTGFDYLF